jgi:hypothetical protein
VASGQVAQRAGRNVQDVLGSGKQR